MNVKLVGSLLAVSLIACPLLYIFVGPMLDSAQLDTLKILGIITACSWLYCFAVGELTSNNSQMDKLWSLLPIAYVWVVAVRGGLTPRLIVMAVLVTLWGARLTFNFARKGAYRLKFWEGEEDYRWQVLRAKKRVPAALEVAAVQLLLHFPLPECPGADDYLPGPGSDECQHAFWLGRRCRRCPHAGFHRL